jgi:hypothetical protein
MILFLDFDGVLHRNFCKKEDYFSRASILMDALGNQTQTTGPKIVISSSWRFHHEFDEILRLLPKELGLLITGATPEVEPGRYQRYREIRAYLSLLQGNPDWRALDDDIRAFPEKCGQLIACDGRVGIDSTSAKHLRKWLSNAD